MTKEQFDKISKFDLQFRTAVKNNFVRMSQGEFNEIVPVYKEVTGKSFTKSQMLCNNCRLKMVQELGKAYMDYKEWYEKKYGNRKKKGEENSNDLNPTGQNAVEGAKE